MLMQKKRQEHEGPPQGDFATLLCFRVFTSQKKKKNQWKESNLHQPENESPGTLYLIELHWRKRGIQNNVLGEI